MPISISINNRVEFQIFYCAKGFAEGKIVTGYFIYPDSSKSDIFTFNELGDGIYSVTIPHCKQTTCSEEKHGLVVKEDGDVKLFEIVTIRN